MDPSGRQRNLSWILAAVCLAGWIWGGGPESRTPYFFGAGPFFGLAGLGFLLSFAGRALGRPGAAATAWITAAVFLAYAAMELFFQRVPLRVPVVPDGPAAAAFVGIVNEYILDRSYQYVAILVLWLLLRRFLTGVPVPADDGRPAPDDGPGELPASEPAGWTTFLRFGDPSRETTILGGAQPMTWTRVAIRIGVMLLLLGGAHAWLRMDRPVDGVLLATLGGRWLGGFNNSLIEELVFRALLLPALATTLRPGAANLFQAAFFAVIHYTCLPEWELAAVAAEAGRLLLYLGIGWLLGRSAWETRGIAVSTALHFLVTGILWTTLVLMGR
ncbi:MAG: CPBP family intramembrane metalloprotease [Candidatus Riflebacteria bacterium]|nr:CPBP family intramembrane metalloprotease [Candidatus Riflebacteria bacterium]